ncbi:BspA family leucine-rich repeat surface protein [Lactococcus paracarnosus]|uniref:BspA family leucine-rich repeat surface protein n=1 Tax=Pseudolactococcus paracarnosus TaxID=2749962 RepID=A0ABT0ANW9_9LACT|nr:BspA family leucine-rich repeat surface protein [Lactococcus paracarnosus]MCJ1978228.1 BspA family leucine-rich repeat surface protein [Lactococcus paracarnosus]MCJ1984371.1 BspA family leucine-rich repeat surface protein [Lactococcus paracarnosus]MCJ1999021.1 BspA family leucine-rich repeat surface protein [Lactococcus paracarnosus]
MKKNRLFILFSMIFLITTISLTSIARAVAIKQDTTDVSSDDTEKNKEQETGSSSAADEQRTDEQETALSTTDQQKDEVIASSTNQEHTETGGAEDFNDDALKWKDATWTFDRDSGILTINSGELGSYESSPWRRSDDKKIDGNQVKQIIFSGDNKAPKYSGSLFANLPNLTEIVNLAKLDTSQATNMDRMFLGCRSLKSIDLSQFNTGNVTSTEWMFQDCSSLTELNLKAFDTSNVTKIWMMFSGCASLTSIDLSNLDVKNVATMGKLFYGCSSLTSINLSGFDTSSAVNMGHMFQGCTSLKNLDLSSFKIKKVTTMMQMFRDVPLSSLTLGADFKFIGIDAGLSNPTALNTGDKLTGNWIKNDGKSAAYTTKNFIAKYGKTDDLKAGTYVAELKNNTAILETAIAFSTDSGGTVAKNAVIGDQLQGEIIVKHSAASPTEATAVAVKLSNIKLLTDVWALSPTVTVTTFDQTGKQTASNEQTIKNNELSLPTLPYGSYFKIRFTGTVWEKSDASPGYNCQYTLYHKNKSGTQKVEKTDNFIINSGALNFKSVPNISFNDSYLPTEFNQIIDRKDADYAISVADYRSAQLPSDDAQAKPDRRNWDVIATASPFKDAAGKEIKLSTMAISFTNEFGETTELGPDAVGIASHDVAGETPKQHNLTKLSWTKDKGFKVVVHNRTDLDTTSYTAEVAFDLRTAP